MSRITNEVFRIGRTFSPRLDPTRTPRETAIWWATDEWKAIQ
jgi:hypothetical protein